MRKTIIILLVFISLVAIILRFGTSAMTQVFGIKQRAGLRVESSQKTEIYINDKDRGLTPFQDEGLTEGEYIVSLKGVEGTRSAQELWRGYVKLNGGTLTVVNRDVSDSKTTASGESINLDKGQGATIISIPNEAEVSIDGQVVGRTPLTLPTLAPGEHLFILSKENYLKRSIRSTLVEGYKLTLNVDLAMSEPDLTQLPTVPISTSTVLVVRQTPTGFLRVRKSPSLSGEEITRVTTGEELTLLEEVPSWYKIRTSDEKEGYVSAAYVDKKVQ